MQASIKRFRIIDRVMGWLVFLIAATVYIVTLEPSASFWDCPEFILSGYKLEIGHPPGAPFFMLTANLFSQFAVSPADVARMVNLMSALLSALTILFLFWTITHLVRVLLVPRFLHESVLQLSLSEVITIEAAGAVGALIFTFSDTFWFSAVEGEVYAYSSAFTAAVFWLVLKWEDEADHPHSDRWLVLIAYLTGLSIGVHLLNLLCLSALALVFYYRRWQQPTLRGVLMALLASFLIIGFILYILIPGVCTMGGWLERLMVNVLHCPYQTGVFLYLIILFGGLSAAIVYTHRRGMRLSSTVLLSVLMLLIGYGSYALVLIRANANTPMSQNGCKDIFTLSRYLARDQYPHGPLLYGQAYTSQIKLQPEGDYCVPVSRQGKAIWQQVPKDTGTEADAYTVVGHQVEYVYEPQMLFPRMWNPDFANAYEAWAGGLHGPVSIVDRCGQPTAVQMPSTWDNLRFFLQYQCGFMYWRYFLWNFAGRQNDIQGHGEPEHGNWLTGFPVIDNLRLGNQRLLPDYLQANRGHNVFYCLPLLLGLIGLCWQAFRCGSRGRRQFWVISVLFFMTGLAIVVYLNQTPFQPRERDYAYVGSFYAFAIWCGLGVAALVSAIHLPQQNCNLQDKVRVVGALLFLIVPLQMVTQTWDDHDRSGRFVCRDAGHNYLASLPEEGNSIILTNGDNDTFPLWYAQEVEGYRLDVRVCNMSYLQTDWYISQMCRKAYQSPPLPIDWKPSEYQSGRNEAYPLDDLSDDTLRLDDRWKIPLHGRRVLYKQELMLLEMLRNSDRRPLYVAESVGESNYLNLDSHTVCEGLAFRFEPPSHAESMGAGSALPRIDTEKTYRNVMTRFRFTSLDNPHVYLDETCRNMAYRYRRLFARLALALIREQNPQKAAEVLKKADRVIPLSCLPPDLILGYDLEIARAYLLLGKKTEAKKRIEALRKTARSMLRYYESYHSDNQMTGESERARQQYILEQIEELEKYMRP